MKDPVLLQAFQSWEELSSTKEQMLAYESRLKHVLDEEAAVIEAELRVKEAEKRAIEAREEGKKEGKIEGRLERDLEIARSLILKGMDNAFIQGVTNLSVDTIERLRADSSTQ